VCTRERESEREREGPEVLFVSALGKSFVLAKKFSNVRSIAKIQEERDF